jgi:hypothetical protein
VGLHHAKYACYVNLVFIPCKACFISDEYTVTKKRDLQQTVRRTTGSILGMGKNQLDLELIPISNVTVNCSGRTYYTVADATCSAACM